MIRSYILFSFLEKDNGGNDKGSSEKKEKVKPKSKLKEEEETMKIIFNETTENLKKLSLPDVNVKSPPTCNKIMQENQSGKPQTEKEMESRGNLKEDTVFDDSRPERGGRRQGGEGKTRGKGSKAGESLTVIHMIVDMKYYICYRHSLRYSLCTLVFTV